MAVSSSELGQLIEIETEKDGRLPFTSITPIFPGTAALMFRAPGSSAFCREVPVEEGNFLAPEGGWGVSARYIARPELNKTEGEKRRLGQLRTPAMEKDEELGGNLDAIPDASLEVVKEEHQAPNPPESSPIPDPGEASESDNDVLVIDLSDNEEVEEPEKRYKKSDSGSTSLQRAEQNISPAANKPKKLGVEKSQVGTWRLVNKRLGPECRVICPNLNQSTATAKGARPMVSSNGFVKWFRPCGAMVNLRNLGRHILRQHPKDRGCIDKLRCPDCDEHVSAESLQHHFQQRHKTCSMKCMSKSSRTKKNLVMKSSTSVTTSTPTSS